MKNNEKCFRRKFAPSDSKSEHKRAVFTVGMQGLFFRDTKKL